MRVPTLAMETGTPAIPVIGVRHPRRGQARPCVRHALQQVPVIQVPGREELLDE